MTRVAAKPKGLGHHQIRSMEVIGGFLDGLKLNFHGGMNAIIGARGAGKTTVLEFVRYALGLEPERDGTPIANKRALELIHRNLGGGRIELHIQTRDGMEYKITRSEDEEPIIVTEDGSVTDLTLRSGFFVANIFSQNEVESIADNSLAQLQLIDVFASAEIEGINLKLRHLSEDLNTNAGRIGPLNRQIELLADEMTEMPSVKARLEAFTSKETSDTKASNKALAAKALREREGRAVGDIGRFLESLRTEQNQQSGRLMRQIQMLFGKDIQEGGNSAVIKRIIQSLETCARDIDALQTKVQEKLADEYRSLAKTAHELKALHDRQELEFHATMQKHEQAQGEAVERTRLDRRYNELMAREQQRADFAAQREKLQLDRALLLESLSELRRQRYQRRKEIALQITSQVMPRVRVDIQQDGDTTLYSELLTSALGQAKAGVRIASVVQKITAALTPADLAVALRHKQPGPLIDRAGLNAEQAEKVLSALGNPEMSMQIESVELGDLPCIELQDGNQYKASHLLSTGQKCTAILPIMLLECVGPLWVDQPEDNLDNRYIYETVLASLQKVKDRRQMVFITHNPNIPVLADADRVFVLESDGSAARLKKQGDVDECKEDIVTLLEGGEAAFKERKKRYKY
ncbi:AAA family ATPase [Oscillatoria laete-virens NRMC-F 0139]|nr:AAA family ATPase [Oscillatoria laete-virens]MDL5053327.1 AAA family ATPase [Oscillatoria laete-virens NRMC-F 0139]